MRRKQQITPGSIIKLGVFSGFLAIVLFLIIQLVWVESIKKNYMTEYPDSFWVVIILYSGFLISGICAIISVIFSAEGYNIIIALWSALFALVINLLLWTIIAYCFMYNDINAAGVERIIILPKTLAYFAAFYFEKPTEIWLYAQISFTVIFCVIFYVFLKKTAMPKFKSRRIKRR